MKFAYADPPYIGQAHRYAEKQEVCHIELLARLVNGFPDGWALSCSSPSLKYILSLCPDDVRIMAWVKPFASFKPGVGVAYAWEPVIVRGGRKRTREQLTIRDWVSANITLQKGIIGAKPEPFVYWLLDVLNFHEGDELTDLYPGSGIVGRVTDKFAYRF